MPAKWICLIDREPFWYVESIAQLSIAIDIWSKREAFLSHGINRFLSILSILFCSSWCACVYLARVHPSLHGASTKHPGSEVGAVDIRAGTHGLGYHLHLSLSQLRWYRAWEWERETDRPRWSRERRVKDRWERWRRDYTNRSVLMGREWRDNCQVTEWDYGMEGNIVFILRQMSGNLMWLWKKW